MIQGPGQWNDPLPAHASICWFETNRATEGRRNADRASGIGSDSQQRHTTYDRSRRATATATWNTFHIPGIACWWADHTIGEFVSMRLAQQNSSRFLKFLV